MFIFTLIKKQVLTTFTNDNLSRFCFMGTTPGPVLALNVRAKVDSLESNSGPEHCEANSITHNHRHHHNLHYKEGAF